MMAKPFDFAGPSPAVEQPKPEPGTDPAGALAKCKKCGWILNPSSFAGHYCESHEVTDSRGNVVLIGGGHPEGAESTLPEPDKRLREALEKIDALPISGLDLHSYMGKIHDIISEALGTQETET